MPRDLRRLSKFLAYLLRHHPNRFGLTLDAGGFADLEAVWQVVTQRFGSRYQREDLERLAREGSGGKRRFEIRAGRIRALYGHSRRVGTIHYGDPVQPPEILYHGTNPKAVENIRAQGLLPGKRQMVHLSRTPERALEVGRRHTAHPVLLRIRAQEAAQAGIPFYRTEPEHFLAPHIPPSSSSFRRKTHEPFRRETPGFRYAGAGYRRPAPPGVQR